MEFVRKKVTWKKQSVDEYGGDGEYAGSFEKPDFVNIQRANPGDCVVAKQAETGHWYWFRDDDTQLPWVRLREDGACEVHEGKQRSFLPAEQVGPFATEHGAKIFGESFARQQLFEKDQRRKAEARYEEARKALVAVLGVGDDD